jgi:hypothetical protein
MRHARALTAAVVALLAVPGAALGARPPVRDVVVHAGTGLGEPRVAVNPQRPSDLVVGENNSGVSVSHDRGRSWKQVALPNPGDNVLAVGPGGTFSYSSLEGDVWSSRDRGGSWADRGNWVGAVAAQARATEGTGIGPVAVREAACSSPEPEGPASTTPGEGPGPQVIGCDRPWLVADSTTGALYVSFTDHDDSSGGVGAPGWELGSLVCRSTVLTNPAFECGRQYVASSRDRGRTWSAFTPFDSSEYPAGVTGGFSAGPVASRGILATSYIASAAPGRSDCPCVVFETSSDAGLSWHRRLVPTTVKRGGVLSTEQSTLFEPYTAGDPSHPGRYAVMVFDPGQAHLLVYVTHGFGATWQHPARLAESNGQKRYLPWIAYGPTGALGVVWRTEYADGAYAAWAAVAPRGDNRFARPVRLSSARSPGPVSQLAGDDASDVALDGGYLHAAWGDRRGGKLGVRYGRYHYVADPAVRALSRGRRDRP